MAAPHSIIPSGYDRRSPQLISEVNAAVKQCHAVPITELRWTTFTDSGFDTGDINKVGWCVPPTSTSTKNGRLQSASLAKSKAHTKSGDSTAGGNLCSKFSSGRDDMDQSIVGIDDLERL